MRFFQGRRRSGRAGGAEKGLRAIETYKKQKIVTKYACLCSATMLTSRRITEIIEKAILNCLGARIPAINLLQVNLHKP